jgi:hypothetical protein
VSFLITMTRAASRSLRRTFWGQLTPATMLPRDLCTAALRAWIALVLLGPVRTENVSWISPLWRGRLNALQEIVPVEWVAPSGADHTWFRGTVKPVDRTNDPTRSDIVSCADPRQRTLRICAAAVAGPTREERAIADAQVQAAAAAVVVIEHSLEKMILLAPADGVVSVIVAEVGEKFARVGRS